MSVWCQLFAAANSVVSEDYACLVGWRDVVFVTVKWLFTGLRASLILLLSHCDQTSADV